MVVGLIYCLSKRMIGVVKSASVSFATTCIGSRRAAKSTISHKVAATVLRFFHQYSHVLKDASLMSQPPRMMFGVVAFECSDSECTLHRFRTCYIRSNF